MCFPQNPKSEFPFVLLKVDTHRLGIYDSERIPWRTDEQVTDRSNWHGGPSFSKYRFWCVGSGGTISGPGVPWRAGAGKHRQSSSESPIRHYGDLVARWGI